MTDFAYTGKKGTGKSKNAVRVARDVYFAEGRSVATNLDIFLEPMFGPQSRRVYVRIPDKPTEFDLLAAGHGNADSYNEDKNGALILDELGTWMNTRTFADKQRAGTLNYLALARKYGWDCIYIMQNIVQVDKQLRESFIEFCVRHTRFDKVKIPFVGGLLCALFGKKAGYLPRFHTAVTRLGCNPMDLKTDSAMFVGRDIEKCYDTRQVFTDNYPHGSHSVLSPWHITGRFSEPPKLPYFARLALWLRQCLSGVPLVVCTAKTRPEPFYAECLVMVKNLPTQHRAAMFNKLLALRLEARAVDALASTERAAGPLIY